MGDTTQIMDTTSYETLEAKTPKDISLEAGTEIEYIKYGDNIKITRKK